MPHKFNAARRHKFDKAQYRVINWAEYNESLRQRGDLTIWVSEEAAKCCGARRAARHGVASGDTRIWRIETCLTLRATYRLPLATNAGTYGIPSARSWGWIYGCRDLLHTVASSANGLSIAQAPSGVRHSYAGSIPVHLVVTTVPVSRSSAESQNGSRRSIKSREYAAAGANSTSGWTAASMSGAIVCANLTHDDVGDSTALPRLLDQVDAPVTGFLADGAYDGASTRDLLRERYGETLDVVIPPPKNAVIRPQSARDPTVRDRHIAQIRSNGRMACQVATGYNQRSRIETQIGRWKGVIGPKLKSRSFSSKSRRSNSARKS